MMSTYLIFSPFILGKIHSKDTEPLIYVVSKTALNHSAKFFGNYNQVNRLKFQLPGESALIMMFLCFYRYVSCV